MCEGVGLSLRQNQSGCVLLNSFQGRSLHPNDKDLSLGTSVLMAASTLRWRLLQERWFLRQDRGSELGDCVTRRADLGSQHAKHADCKRGAAQHQGGKIFARDECEFRVFLRLGGQCVWLIADQGRKA
jgi:hypothetical protein